LKRDKKKIEDCLGVSTELSTIAGMDVVGSCGVATNLGCLLHRDVREDELGLIQDILRVETDIGTANFGSPFVGACVIANSKGAVVGESSTGPEITRLMETLKYI
jgi:translation initiation factor 6